MSSDGGVRSRAAGLAAPRPAEWSLQLLDGWHLHRGDGTPAEVATRERRLLTLLALRGERPRPYVARLLWPDSEDARAHGNLRVAVWNLQHRLPGLLAGQREAVGLAHGVHVDVHELRVAAEHPAGPTSELLPELLRLLDHEELLPGWSDPWVDEERELVHHYRLRALEDLAQRALDTGASRVALELAMRAVSADPLRESAHRILISVHLHEGNHAEALRVYHAFFRRLVEDVGVAPSDRIRQLVDGVLVASQAEPGRPDEP